MYNQLKMLVKFNLVFVFIFSYNIANFFHRVFNFKFINDIYDKKTKLINDVYDKKTKVQAASELSENGKEKDEDGDSEQEIKEKKQEGKGKKKIERPGFRDRKVCESQINFN